MRNTNIIICVAALSLLFITVNVFYLVAPISLRVDSDISASVLPLIERWLREQLGAEACGQGSGTFSLLDSELQSRVCSEYNRGWWWLWKRRSLNCIALWNSIDVGSNGAILRKTELVRNFDGSDAVRTEWYLEPGTTPIYPLYCRLIRLCWISVPILSALACVAAVFFFWRRSRHWKTLIEKAVLLIRLILRTHHEEQLKQQQRTPFLRSHRTDPNASLVSAAELRELLFKDEQFRALGEKEKRALWSAVNTALNKDACVQYRIVHLPGREGCLMYEWTARVSQFDILSSRHSAARRR